MTRYIISHYLNGNVMQLVICEFIRGISWGIGFIVAMLIFKKGAVMKKLLLVVLMLSITLPCFAELTKEEQAIRQDGLKYYLIRLDNDRMGKDTDSQVAVDTLLSFDEKTVRDAIKAYAAMMSGAYQTQIVGITTQLNANKEKYDAVK